ncbi:hypothetical protein [Bacillus cereus]|uniref:beta barrel domain-containing protein n=1 Tax=Bacillus cereus TaxID=1396 RepID=UPI0011A0DE34|nr:hypothetical protein [Bacillus cereus]
MAKIKVQEGQEIFVTNLGGWYSRPEPNLEKWIVVKANGTSFYANPEGVEDRSPYKFSQKDLTHSNGWGDDRKAYLTENEYWGMIERNKERKSLRMGLKIKIDKMSLTELRELDKQIS